MTPSRTIAYEVLERVEGGGYASDILRARSSSLGEADAGLASEIVFGCLRRQPQLDFLIGLYSGRVPARLDGEVRIALRMGIYQIRYLDRVPRHAAVSESVELVKRARKRSAAGFVNAVLRKVNRDPVDWPDTATELCVPAWMLARWEREYGLKTAEGIARACLEPPETYVRVPPGSQTAGLRLEPTGVEGCYRLLGGDAGPFRVQDIGSQSIVPLLGLEAGQTFLDVCAAPGNKTAQALEAGVRAVACDRYWSRLNELRGIDCCLAVADGTAPLPFSRLFDRILLDAPCSGTGTLRRNPEIKWRLGPGDLPGFQARQVRLLENALQRLAPGGRLVYSTCSLEREENEDVVEPVLRNVPGWSAEYWRRLPGRDPGDGFFAAVITSR